MFTRLCRASRAAPEERVENLTTLPPDRDRDDHSCLTFCPGLDCRHPLMTHVVEAEGASPVNSTACS